MGLIWALFDLPYKKMIRTLLLKVAAKLLPKTTPPFPLKGKKINLSPAQERLEILKSRLKYEYKGSAIGAPCYRAGCNNPAFLRHRLRKKWYCRGCAAMINAAYSSQMCVKG